MHSVFLLSGGWTQALQLIAALSLLIILHEFGHFLFARLFKTRVEKFYLFFDFLFPFPNILNFSLFKRKKGGTEWGIGWFPMGGYVKIAGMVDESNDKEALKEPPKPDEFRSKTAVQRLFIMLGGIIVNVVVAMIIYAGMFMYWGEDYLASEDIRHGVVADSLAQNLLGLQSGDIPVGLDGKPEERFRNITLSLLLDKPKTMEVIRDGQTLSLPLPQTGIVSGIMKAQRDFIQPRVPAVVEEVLEKSPAAAMGLQPGDSLLAMNGQPVRYYDEMVKVLRANPGQPIRLTVVRNQNQMVMLDGRTDSLGQLGFRAYSGERFYKQRHIDYSFGGAIARGITYTGFQLGFYMKQFRLLFTKEVKVSENLGGIGTFAKLFPQQFDWHAFWALTAFVSLILAFMNLLPIPGLDGGYVIFLLWEIITRRKVSDRVLEVANTVGLVLLLALMLYANGLDILRAIRG